MVLTKSMVAEALAFFGDDKYRDTEVFIQYGPGHSGTGYYISFVDYPDEGSMLLGEADDE